VSVEFPAGLLFLLIEPALRLVFCWRSRGSEEKRRLMWNRATNGGLVCQVMEVDGSEEEP
jgi:hypothetical protein